MIKWNTKRRGWSAFCDKLGNWFVITGSVPAQADCVATMSSAGNETWARARIMAAAPKLFEALQELYQHGGEIEVNGIGMECDSDALENAKAKAREILKELEGYDNG